MTIDLKYPTTWDEVTREHLLMLGKLMTRKLTREELLFDLLCKITGLRPLLKQGIDEDTMVAEYHFKMKGKGKFSMPAWMIRQACEDLSFLVDTVGLPECPILSVHSKLHDVSFKAFYFADAYLSRYQVTKDEDLMLKMYKELTGRQVRNLDKAEVNAIVIWWCGLKEYLKQSYPEVLKDGDEQTDKTPADVLNEILSVLNKNEPHMNKEILKSDVHAVMHALNNIYLTAKQHDNK